MTDNRLFYYSMNLTADSNVINGKNEPKRKVETVIPMFGQRQQHYL